MNGFLIFIILFEHAGYRKEKKSAIIQEIYRIGQNGGFLGAVIARKLFAGRHTRNHMTTKADVFLAGIASQLNRIH